MTLDVRSAIPAVYTAHSKHTFFCRDVISQFVLLKGALPLNPFRIFDYFLGDRADRDLVRRGNNNLVRIADETWVFGSIADGVFLEIQHAMSLGRRVRFFSLGTWVEDITEVEPAKVEFEEEVLEVTGMSREELLDVLVQAHKA